MQEVFEKIDAILQKYRKKWLEQPNTEPCKGLECISNDCVDCMLTHLENDINQVAEEYVGKTDMFGNSEQVNDICEWKQKKGFIINPHTGRYFSNETSMKNHYCNTCGKKIKVVE